MNRDFSRADTVTGRTITQCTVVLTPWIHTRVPGKTSIGFTPSGRRFVCWRRGSWSLWSAYHCHHGCVWDGLLRGGSRTSCWGDPNICAVHKSLLCLPQAHSAVAVLITAPVVTHCPPPLYHAVITCQTFGKHELDLEHSSVGRVKRPCVGAIRLQQNVLQLFLSDGTFLELAHAEPKESLMIWSDPDADLDLLSFCVCLRDETVLRVPARVDVPRVCKMISISTHATFAFVLTPLDAEASAVQLVICVLGGTIGKEPPCGVSAGRIYQHTMTEYQGNQARNHEKTKYFSCSHCLHVWTRQSFSANEAHNSLKR